MNYADYVYENSTTALEDYVNDLQNEMENMARVMHKKNLAIRTLKIENAALRLLIEDLAQK